MKNIPDKEAIEKIKAVLAVSSPAVRRSLLALLQPPTPPKPRSISQENVQVLTSPPPRVILKVDTNTESGPVAVSPDDDEWWKRY